MNVQQPRRRPDRAATTHADGRKRVDDAMLATCRIVLAEAVPVRAKSAVFATAAPEPRLGRRFHSVRMAWPRASSPTTA